MGRQDQTRHDHFLFDQGPARGLGKILFHDYAPAYGRYDLPNVHIFGEQIALFKEALLSAAPDAGQQQDTDLMLALGEIFILVVYGQLILENASIYKVGEDVVDQIFDFMVRDFSRFALQLYSKRSATPAQAELLLKMIRRPAADPEKFNRFWRERVLALKDAYEMNS